MEKSGYIELFNTFNNLNVLIIGDVMVDSYIWGKVNRISPEAPVPIVEVEKRENRLGGAANVALNIKAMGANPVLCSLVGDDLKGKEFMELLRAEGMDDMGMVISRERITTTKFRVIGNKMQLLRVDEEVVHNLSNSDNQLLSERFRAVLGKFPPDVLIFQDYDKGVITTQLISSVIEWARENNIPVAVDPKKKNFRHYQHVNLFKPNLKEISEGLNLEIRTDHGDQLKNAVAALRKLLKPEVVLVTLSDKGILVDYEEEGNHKHHIMPSIVRSVSDVSGAGDTVISVAALCLAKKIHPEEMAFISNLAGGQVCEKVGVVPVDKNRLLNEILRLKQ
ncbi:MAG: bifunctional heptose 7-phosphate kinase/heptose 1-phosphate adenyltransferase [Bacteroidales bacterium]